MSEQEVITLRLTEKERDYLENIATRHNLKKPASEDWSPAKALKFLINYCFHNNLKIADSDNNDFMVLRKMVEQIHAVIPHVLFQNQFQSLILANKFGNDDIGEIKHSTIQYLNENFSGFQNISYKEVKVKINGIGLKTIPLEQGISIWK